MQNHILLFIRSLYKNSKLQILNAFAKSSKLLDNFSNATYLIAARVKCTSSANVVSNHLHLFAQTLQEFHQHDNCADLLLREVFTAPHLLCFCALGGRGREYNEMVSDCQTSAHALTPLGSVSERVRAVKQTFSAPRSR